MQQMLDYAREAAALAEGRTRSDLDRNRMLELALTWIILLLVILSFCPT